MVFAVECYRIRSVIATRGHFSVTNENNQLTGCRQPPIGLEMCQVANCHQFFCCCWENLIHCLDSNNSVIQTVCIDGGTCDARRRVPPRIRCLTHATERTLPDFVTLFNISRTPLERYFLKHENVRYDVFQRKCIMLSVNK